MGNNTQHTTQHNIHPFELGPNNSNGKGRGKLVGQSVIRVAGHKGVGINCLGINIIITIM